MRRWFVSMLLPMAALLWLCGCRGGLPAAPNLVTIQGKVTVAGKPLEAGEVQLHPENAKEGAWSGLVGGGEYTANAPVGRYKVTVTAPPTDEPGPTRIPQEYANSGSTPLSITVVASPSPGAYDLILK
jgi:hypothetical protein